MDRCKKFELKGQKEVLDINGEDSDLTSISLLPDKIANSLTDFLVKQKVIKNKRNSCVEFWGEDGSGKYVCLISANPWEIGWEIDADSKKTKILLYDVEYFGRHSRVSQCSAAKSQTLGRLMWQEIFQILWT